MSVPLKLTTAIGTTEDFKKLIESFSTSSIRLSFRDFAKEWQALMFYHIFRGREPIHELPEFIGELFQICVRYLQSTNPLPARVSALYSLYGLYSLQFKRPRLKVRLTSSDIKELQDLLKSLKARNLHEAEFVLWKLVLSNTFYFCVSSSQFIFNKQARAEDEELPGSLQSELVELLSGDTLSELSALHSRYQEIKQEISDTTDPEAGVSVIKTEFVQSVEKQLRDLQKNIDKSQVGKSTSKAAREDPQSNDESSSGSSDSEDIGKRRRRLVASGMRRPAARQRK